MNVLIERIGRKIHRVKDLFNAVIDTVIEFVHITRVCGIKRVSRLFAKIQLDLRFRSLIFSYQECLFFHIHIR